MFFASSSSVNSVSLPQTCNSSAQAQPWHTFEQVLSRLHCEGILVHPNQLAEFYLRHGLPVDLQYVPAHLQAKAIRINDNYQGDMARLEAVEEATWYAILLE